MVQKQGREPGHQGAADCMWDVEASWDRRQRERVVRKECEFFVEVFPGRRLHHHIGTTFKEDISELKTPHLPW